MEAISNFYKKHQKACLIALTGIIIILIIFIIYICERYLLYNIIYYLLHFIQKLSKYNNIYIISLKFESIIIIIYLHIIFARLVILSIIFPQGGFFKTLMVFFFDYNSLTSLIIDKIIEIFKSIDSNDIEQAELYIQDLNIFCLNEKNNIRNKYIQYEKDLYEALDLYNDYKNENEISKKKEIKKKLLQFLQNICEKKLNIDDYTYKEFFLIYNTHEALLLMENYMKKSFLTHNVEKINISNNFDIYLISPKKIDKHNNILTIFCNQNSLNCEFYFVAKDNLQIYLNILNCNIIIWNYKGYGLRKGFTTFGSIDKDVQILSNYINKNFDKYKIIIHGTSIGGYSSVRLAQKIPNSVLICDRTFGDIKYIVKTLDKYHILYFIYNILFPKYLFKYNNINNYISLPSNKKMILYDENDEVIPYNPSGLIYCIAKKYYNEIIKAELIKYKEYSTFLNNIKEYSEALKQICEINTIQSFDKYGKFFLNKLNKNFNDINELLMNFIIFGYPFNLEKEIELDINDMNKNYINIIFIIKDIIKNNKNIIPNKILELISILNFLYIKCNLLCAFKDDVILKFKYYDEDLDDKESFWINPNTFNKLKNYFGFVHRISCGHNGLLEENDIEAILLFLKNNKYI